MDPTRCLTVSLSTLTTPVPKSLDSASGAIGRRVLIGAVIRRRSGPCLVAIAMLVVGMAFELFWGLVVHHESSWFSPLDAWGMFRAAHYVGWGDLGGVYTTGNGLVSFPGMPVILSPLAVLNDHLHLTESYPPFSVAQPTAIFLLVPAELLLSSTAVFAADALAERLECSVRRRFALCVVVGALAWTTSAVWGHAEDCLAVALAMFAMMAFADGRWAWAGWLFGFGVVCQPLIALVLPIYLASTPRGGRMLFLIRCSLVSAVLVGMAFLGDSADTLRALTTQATPPGPNHATPLASFAPRSVVWLNGGANLNQRGGRFVTTTGATHQTAAIMVSGGAFRLVYVALAVLIGVYVWRKPQPPHRLLWLAGAVLAARCLFEAVMLPYYLVPPFIVLLTLAAAQVTWRFWVAVSVVALTGLYAYKHLGPWQWWVPVVAGTAAVVFLAWPRRGRRRRSQACHRRGAPG